MRKGTTMKAAKLDSLVVDGRRVEYRLILSKTAKKLRVRVGVSGVDVIQPEDRNGGQVSDFLEANGDWIVDQLDRIERFRSIRKPSSKAAGTILLRGEQTPIAVETHPRRGGANQVRQEGAKLVV